MKMKNLVLIGLLTLLVSVANAERSVPVMVGGTTSSYACKGTGKVVGLKSNGDGFLAVRNGPGKKHSIINKIYNNDEVLFCDQEGKWIGIVYGDNCGLNKSLAKRQSYSGQCKSGWVYNKFVKIQSQPSDNAYSSNPIQVPTADISAIKIRVNSIVKQIESCVYLTPERTALGISRTKSRMSGKDGKIFESMVKDRLKYITYCDNNQSKSIEKSSNDYTSVTEKDEIEKLTNDYNSMTEKDEIERDKESTNSIRTLFGWLCLGLAVFSTYKTHQSKGRSRLENINMQYGGGSFFGMIGSHIATFLWGIAMIGFLMAGIALIQNG